MRTVTSNVYGDLVVDGHVALYGFVTGDAVIPPGGRLDLYGVVGGDVHSRGGEVAVFGAVRGRLTGDLGRITVHPGATVGGARRRDPVAGDRRRHSAHPTSGSPGE